MDEYNDMCPVCGGQIYLIGAVISCRVPIYEDGWALSEGPVDTSEEVFVCSASCLGDPSPVPAKWVFGNIQQEEAVEIMRTRDPLEIIGEERWGRSKS